MAPASHAQAKMSLAVIIHVLLLLAPVGFPPGDIFQCPLQGSGNPGKRLPKGRGCDGPPEPVRGVTGSGLHLHAFRSLHSPGSGASSAPAWLGVHLCHRRFGISPCPCVRPESRQSCQLSFSRPEACPQNHQLCKTGEQAGLAVPAMSLQHRPPPQPGWGAQAGLQGCRAERSRRCLSVGLGFPENETKPSPSAAASLLWLPLGLLC